MPHAETDAAAHDLRGEIEEEILKLLDVRGVCQKLGKLRPYLQSQGETRANTGPHVVQVRRWILLLPPNFVSDSLGMRWGLYHRAQVRVFPRLSLRRF